jgi:2-polyprenyl-3-methyl-5-hydroxy-6-metoxy-1,4-benzoquinol methylase
VTAANDLASLRSRLYEAYASGHAGRAQDGTVDMIYRRDFRPLLPPVDLGVVIDIGCGQGELVRCLLRDGYDAEGVDVSPEQVALAHEAGLSQVQLGDYREALLARSGRLAAVTASDLLEHLTKTEVMDTFDRVAAALVPGGVFVARVPNAGSPFGGRIRHGDVTHESWYTTSSIRQLATAAGFESIEAIACPPPMHGLASAVRVAAWKPISGFLKLALAAETGALRGHIVTQNLTFVARAASRQRPGAAGPCAEHR